MPGIQLPGYQLGKTLRLDWSGPTKSATHALTGRPVSVKLWKKTKTPKYDMEETGRHEIAILTELTHPAIIQLLEVVETCTDIALIMESVNTCDLFDYVLERGRLQEIEAFHFFHQVIDAIEYCHKKMIVHFDLRLENILMDFEYNIKLSNFGLSIMQCENHLLKESFGSTIWAAPEVISGNLCVGPKVDVWNCGVILYSLLCGCFPFDDENETNMYKKIKDGIYILPSHLSLEARDLICQMLWSDPSQRVTISEIKQHPWFQLQISCNQYTKFEGFSSN